jgi:hypothetical protein
MKQSDAQILTPCPRIAVLKFSVASDDIPKRWPFVDPGIRGDEYETHIRGATL